MSLIVHGITFEAPHTNQQEMLSYEKQGTSAFGETIYGLQVVPYSNPEMDIDPVLEAVLIWKLTHCKMANLKKTE